MGSSHLAREFSVDKNDLDDLFNKYLHWKQFFFCKSLFKYSPRSSAQHIAKFVYRIGLNKFNWLHISIFTFCSDRFYMLNQSNKCNGSPRSPWKHFLVLSSSFFFLRAVFRRFVFFVFFGSSFCLSIYSFLFSSFQMGTAVTLAFRPFVWSFTGPLWEWWHAKKIMLYRESTTSQGILRQTNISSILWSTNLHMITWNIMEKDKSRRMIHWNYGTLN